MKVGDYVRTKNDGYINKITKVNQYNVYVDGRELFGETLEIPINEIIKSSPNIVNLIQVGDFIDGKKVVKVIHYSDGFNRIELFGGKAIMNKTPIKSIVTKEQFSQMEYKIGE